MHEPTKCKTFGFNLNIKRVTIFRLLESEALNKSITGWVNLNIKKEVQKSRAKDAICKHPKGQAPGGYGGDNEQEPRLTLSMDLVDTVCPNTACHPFYIRTI